jgi:ribose 5-phosphate isomerase A
MKAQEESKNLKKIVGLAAADLVKDGMTVGIGTGSTVAFFIEELGRRVRQGLSIRGVPTSYQAKLMCYQHGIPLLDPSLVDRLDIAIDGADEIDYSLNAIKGGGAANTMEKVIATMADEFVIIVDHSKLVEKLAVSFPVPVEVIPAALGLVMRKVREIGARPELRMAVRKAGPVVTDNGNFVVDLYFDEAPDVYRLNRVLKSIPGVVETGLFLGMAHKALVAWEDGVEVMLASQKD